MHKWKCWDKKKAIYGEKTEFPIFGTVKKEKVLEMNLKQNINAVINQDTDNPYSKVNLEEEL